MCVKIGYTMVYHPFMANSPCGKWWGWSGCIFGSPTWSGLEKSYDRLILQFLHEITIHWLNFTAIYKDAWNHQKGLTDWKSQCLRWASVENSWSVMLCSPQSNQGPFIASSAGLDHETALFWIIFLMFWLFVFSSIPTTELKSNYVPKVGPGLEGAIDWHQGHCIIMFNSYGKQITWQNAMSCLDV